MTATFNPQQDATLPHSIAPPHANGKAATALSIAATRPEFWRKTAPRQLRIGRIGSEHAWDLYWQKRAVPAAISSLCCADGTPLRWAIDARWLSPPASELLDQLAVPGGIKRLGKPGRAMEKHRLQVALDNWTSHAKHMAPGYELAVGCLAAAHILGEKGGALDAAIGWKVLDLLADTARHAASWSPLEPRADLAVAQQMLAVELPLTLAYLFPEMQPLHRLRTGVAERLCQATDELLNRDGLPRAHHLDAMRPLLACWTRCRAMAAELKRGQWPRRAKRQYKALLRQSLRWTDADGRLALHSDGDPWRGDFLKAALRIGGGKKDAAAARRLLADKKAGGAKPSKRIGLPVRSVSCDSSGLTLMRSGWHAGAALVAVDFSSPEVQLHAWAAGRKLLGGAWTVECSIDGVARKPHGSWDELCWFSDNDVDYLELSLPLEGGAWIERQVLLAHKDQFLILADHLKHATKAHLEYAWELPLGRGLLLCGEGETRDALIIDGSPLARLTPLALPEWRIDPRIGELSFTAGAIHLAQRAMSSALACPLFVDLNPHRAGQPSTWRQLTVAESLAIQSSDVAVGYRVQAGKDQWVYYRSQGPRGNRTFLGQNTSSELLVARFRAPAGEIETLVEIEG